jgi:glycosyltransferase involved in cell wall biosynthesis
MDELSVRGIPNTRLWSRGIDHGLFHGDQPDHPRLANLPKPVMISVGRVSVEKNLEAFLSAEVAGSKVVIGDGPALSELRIKYPNAVFLGTLKGTELASAYATADVFVFPSRTDTFGLVMIEALASGLPVAAFPVPGPLDIIGPDGRGPWSELSRPIGSLSDDLSSAIQNALSVRKADAAAYAQSFDWDRCTDQFIGALGEVTNQNA